MKGKSVAKTFLSFAGGSAGGLDAYARYYGIAADMGVAIVIKIT
jgi:hypothetical protein